MVAEMQRDHIGIMGAVPGIGPDYRGLLMLGERERYGCRPSRAR
jgi:hypothetical protein